MEGGRVDGGEDDHGDARAPRRGVPGEMERDVDAGVIVHGDRLEVSCRQTRGKNKKRNTWRGYIQRRGKREVQPAK